NSYLEQAKIYREDFKTDEEYNAKVDEYRDLIITNYGIKYVEESALYEHVVAALRQYATSVKYAA
ncbi:MAG: hypothetical protein IKV43_02545, partial [Clostridia bacterium]|nr:hypothetical protein [Clostridia bacterium]